MADALIAHVRAVAAALPEAERGCLAEREAARLGVTAAAWAALCAAPSGLAMLRAAHVAATGTRSHVRRAASDGSWETVAAHPGRLRSRPQCLRAGVLTEAAWAHATLRPRLVALIRDAGVRIATAPFAGAAALVWTLARAQPFLGSNEHTALIAAARLLRDAGLPALAAVELERDPAFLAALIDPEPAALARVLEAAAWDDALAFAEWLGPPAPPDGAPRSLRDEHARLVALRERAGNLPRAALEGFARRASETLVPALAAALRASTAATLRAPTSALLEAFAPAWPASLGERLHVAARAAERGRVVCPQLPMFEQRFGISGGLGVEAVLVVGAAGRGLTGAATAHLALEIAGLPVGGRTPAMLLIAGEAEAVRDRRLAAWVDSALAQLMRDDPCPRT